MSLLPLPAIDSNREAVIHCLAGPGPLRSRLQELGFLPGARVRVVASGSPCIVQLGHARLCLRGEEADSILVACS